MVMLVAVGVATYVYFQHEVATGLPSLQRGVNLGAIFRITGFGAHSPPGGCPAD